MENLSLKCRTGVCWRCAEETRIKRSRSRRLECKPFDAIGRRPPARHGRDSKATFWVVGALRVYIEIDRLHARLRPGVARAGMPGTVAKLNVADLGKRKAFPLALWREAALTSSGELVSQRDLLPVGVAKDDRAKLAGVAIVSAQDLFPAGHRLFEQPVSRAWHGGSRHCWRRALDRQHRKARGGDSVS